MATEDRKKYVHGPENAKNLVAENEALHNAVVSLMDATEPHDVQEVGGEPLEQARSLGTKALGA